jgi:hypothetical protein
MMQITEDYNADHPYGRARFLRKKIRLHNLRQMAKGHHNENPYDGPMVANRYRHTATIKREDKQKGAKMTSPVETRPYKTNKINIHVEIKSLGKEWDLEQEIATEYLSDSGELFSLTPDFDVNKFCEEHIYQCFDASKALRGYIAVENNIGNGKLTESSRICRAKYIASSALRNIMIRRSNPMNEY